MTDKKEKEGISKVGNYLSLIKFSHTVFAMPFAIIGFALGIGTLRGQGSGLAVQLLLTKLAIVLLCMVFARSAAMAFNRYLDREIDRKNARTATREIPAGIISPKKAMAFVLANCILFVLCSYFLNRLCFALSPVALLVILGYSYTKRFTWLCHVVLGVGLSLAPTGAFMAVTGFSPGLYVVFSAIVLFWVAGFDIIYALQDEEFDRANSLYSVPAQWGKARALRISRVLHFICIGLVFSAGFLYPFSYIYYIGAAVFSFLLVGQQRLVKATDLSRVNLAFMTFNGIASIVFAIFVLVDIWLNMLR